MSDFLSGLGGKLAERWLSLLVLPGALFLVVAAVARTQGQSHPMDIRRLTEQITVWAKAPAVGTFGGQVVLLLALLAGSAVMGLVAQWLGASVQRITLAADWRSWPRPVRRLARIPVNGRRSRWSAAARVHEQQRQIAATTLARAGIRVDPAERHAAYRTMMRIAPELPDRPTWCGDRIHAVSVRIERDFHLDLRTVWPNLWLSLPDAVRTEITAAGQALTRATVLGAWAALYLPLTWWWWPAAPLSALLALTSRQQTRAAVDTSAQLMECAVRLYAGALAEHVGIAHTGPVDIPTGYALNHYLSTRLPAPPPAGGTPPVR